jgi:hypothetical protein
MNGSAILRMARCAAISTDVEGRLVAVNDGGREGIGQSPPRNRGAAVLPVSEDLDELLELSDRLIVMFHGRFVYEARASEANLTEIGRHMAGH